MFGWLRNTQRRFEDAKVRANTGDPDAQYQLGLMFAKGADGAPQDFALAITWIMRASDQRHREAMTFVESIPMAVIREENPIFRGLMRELHNIQLAAAARGCTNTQFRLGLRFYSGEGVDQDFHAALRWFLEAAQQGHQAAQFNLGVMLQNGEGARRDYREAVRWFETAARSGHTKALFQLGFLALEGKGVAKDERLAARLFHEAAARNQVDAQAQLATLYGLGLGVASDKAEALKWMLLAARQGMSGTEDMVGFMRTEMSPLEILEGEKRAAEFRPASPS